MGGQAKNESTDDEDEALPPAEDSDEEECDPEEPEDEEDKLLLEMIREEAAKDAPASPPPAPEPAPELFGETAIAALFEKEGARYPLSREKLMAWARGKQVRWWADFPAIPLDELFGLTQLSTFHGLDDVLAVCRTHLRNKPQGVIFSTQHGRKG